YPRVSTSGPLPDTALQGHLGRERPGRLAAVSGEVQAGAHRRAGSAEVHRKAISTGGPHQPGSAGAHRKANEARSPNARGVIAQRNGPVSGLSWTSPSRSASRANSSSSSTAAGSGSTRGQGAP